MAVLVLILIVAAVAYAKYTPKIGVETAGSGTSYLVVNGRKAIDFLVSNGSMSPKKRARVVADRLAAQVAKGINLEFISYKQTDIDAKVLIDDQLLIIVTKSDAKAHMVSTSELASAWIKGLKDALSVPPLSANPTSMLIPLGETRVLSIESLQSDPVEAIIGDPGILAADPNPKPGLLVISGKAIGSSSITLKCGDYTVPIQVSVKKYAAYLCSQPATSVVTGWNAPASLVERATRDAARRSISVEPGADIQAISLLSAATELAPGKSERTPVKIDVSGSDYIPTQLSMPIQVENRIIPAMQSSWIMYSNEPERIIKYQTLFIGRLDALQESFRLLYHHQNMMGRDTGFVIEILNPSKRPATVHAIEGIADPILDTVIVGYKAGMEFMSNHRNLIGRIVDIPGGSRWAILSQTLPSTNTSSGLVEFRQLSGDPMYIRVTAKPEAIRAMEDPPGVVLPIKGTSAASLPLSDHIYPQPEKSIDASYTVGKPWVFLRIGKNALKHASQEKLLYGNYGVTYLINAKLDNPTQRTQKVEIVYEATAGPLSGVFYVDGQLQLVRMLLPPSERVISTLSIPAGQSKSVAIRTMPLSGSAYPSTLIIRPAGTMASAATN